MIFKRKKEKESFSDALDVFTPASPKIFSRLRQGELLVDVYEEGKKIVIEALVPGVKEEDIDIFLKEDIITISSKKSRQKEIAQEKYFIRECPQGEFSRSIVLPHLVDCRSWQMAVQEGVLTIVLSKKA